MLYLWIKAFHIISVIAWMAGLLYLPRLFVYHAGVTPQSEASAMLKTMERRLLRIIMNPAMILTWILGLILIFLDPNLLQQGWLHAKLFLVILMSTAHMLMARWRRNFEADQNTRPAKFYRIANEVPTLLMIFIVLLVILKPF